MRKRTLSLLLASALSLSLALPALAAESDTAPRHYPVLTESEITYVPLRAIAEDLGFSVEWDQATQTATVSNSVYSIQIQPLRRTTSVSYVEGAVSAAMTMKDDRIYVDQSFFEQYLDADITVDGASATAAASSMASTRNTIRANDYDVKETCAYERYEVMVPMDDGVKLRTVSISRSATVPGPPPSPAGPTPLRRRPKIRWARNMPSAAWLTSINTAGARAVPRASMWPTWTSVPTASPV